MSKYKPTEQELKAWSEEWLAIERPRPLLVPEAVIDWHAFVSAKKAYKELDMLAMEKLFSAYNPVIKGSVDNG